MRSRIILLSVSLIHGVISSACSQENREAIPLGAEKHITISPENKGGGDTVSPDSPAFAGIMRHLVHDRPTAKWPVPSEPPAEGAILPYHRVVAYYGNLYSTKMGILGELQPDSMLSRLSREAARWQAADTLLKVLPALHYIAVTAQRLLGKDGKYRLRMPFREIDKVLEMVGRAGAVVFLDIQPGHSSAVAEARELMKYLVLPNVHLGIDPEYNMKNGEVPCSVIGSMDAEEINEVSDYLAGLVDAHRLPPKMLVVHRFTQAMVTNYRSIRLRPQVQVIMNMDGFGGVAKKKDTYRSWIAGQPVQFTGFKLFYRNDVNTGGRLMQPEEVLQLFPSPVYIQYQ